MLGPKKQEVTGGCRKLHNEALHNLHSSQNVIRVTKSRISWVGHAARVGEIHNVFGILVGKPEWKRRLGRHKCIQDNKLKWVLKEIGSEGVEWIHVAQNFDQ
jgi:hypothetical protein